MWPMASSPGSVASTGWVKISATWPMDFVGVDLVAIGGADAGALLAAMLQRVEPEIGQLGGFGVAVDGDDAAFFVELIETRRALRARTEPRDLSDIGFQGPLVSGSERRDFPTAQRDAALPDLDAFLNCNADDRTFDRVFLGDGRDAFGLRGRNQDAGGRFVEHQHFGAEVAREIDLRADLGGAEAALGERDGEAAIAEVVRGFGEAVVDHAADGVLHALFVFHVERGRQAPEVC